MKVNNTNGQSLQGVTQKKSDKADKAGSKFESKASLADLGTSSEVKLSDRAKDIKKATEIARNSSPDVDEAKIAKFQKMIDSGQYKVDAKSVADKLVDEHLMNSLAASDE